MEFLYRAGDERRRCCDDGGAADEQPPPAAGTGADEAAWRWREAKKARIRERILRQDAEDLALEAEVRRELSGQLLLQLSSRPALGPSTAGSSASPAKSVADHSPLPAVVAPPQVALAHSNAKAPEALPAKRKDHAAASSGSAATSSKKQKLGLTCTLCGTTANSEITMKDHINGKGHRRKAAAALPTPPEPADDQEEPAEEEEEDAAAAMATVTSGDYVPTKFIMRTNAGALEEVTQMGGFLLCEACNVRTSDRIAMLCHLEASKHISLKKRRAAAAGESPAAAAAAKERRKQRLALASTTTTSRAAAGGGDPGTVAPEVDGAAHTVRRVEGFLLCDLCGAKAPSESVMRSHLAGKKHKKTASAGPAASVVSVSAGGEEEAGKDAAAVADETAAEPEAARKKPLQEKIGGGNSERQEKTAASAIEDVSASTKTPGKEATAAGDSADLLTTLEVDGVQHHLRRVDGFLVCERCKSKAPSETIMRSHLAGKKHKHRMAAAARGNRPKGASVVATTAGNLLVRAEKGKADGDQTESVPSLLPQAKNGTPMSPMEVGGPAENEPVTAIEPAKDAAGITHEAEGEHAAAKNANGSPVNHAMGSVEADDGTAAPAAGKPAKAMVEGRVFTMRQQGDGRLSCVPCGVHGCDKDGMIGHMYTRRHWDEASLSEKETEQAAYNAAAAVDKAGSAGGNPVGGATVQLEK